MKIIKLFMLPVAAFFLASAAAVSTDKSHESKTALSMDAYIHNPTQFDCQLVQDVNCEPGTGAECTVGGWTGYGIQGSDCSEQLKRIGT